MKIVQISTLWEQTPPPKYGGAELVVSNLTEELVKRGYDVTLFATGNSKTKAKLKSVYPRALYRDGVPWTSMNDTLINVSEAIRYAESIDADIIHNHNSHRALATMELSRVPFVNTVHGTLDPTVIPAPALRTFKRYKKQNFVSISNFQRKHALWLNYVATVYNGIQVDKFKFESNPKADYLVWVGRFTKTKAPHIAIDIAKKLKMKLLMGAKLDKMVPADLDYFDTFIKPELKKGKVEWVGEVDHRDKVALYKDALAYINPLQWDEPFGLVIAESMACGTPVVTYDRGSMREVIKDQCTGFIVPANDEKAFIDAVRNVNSINRATCRDWVERRFSVEAMTDGYLKAYEKVIKGEK